MANIIAGRFDTRDAADQAVAELRSSSFPAAQISCFYVGPAGQHSRYRLGGDHDKSPGAEESARGTMAGTATGERLRVLLTDLLQGKDVNESLAKVDTALKGIMKQ